MWSSSRTSFVCFGCVLISCKVVLFPHPACPCVCLCFVVYLRLSLEFVGPSYLVSFFPDVLMSSVRVESSSHINCGFQIISYAYLSVMYLSSDHAASHCIIVELYFMTNWHIEVGQWMCKHATAVCVSCCLSEFFLFFKWYVDCGHILVYITSAASLLRNDHVSVCVILCIMSYFGVSLWLFTCVYVTGIALHNRICRYDFEKQSFLISKYDGSFFWHHIHITQYRIPNRVWDDAVSVMILIQMAWEGMTLDHSFSFSAVHVYFFMQRSEAYIIHW